MHPLNMHTRGDEMMGTPKEFQMEFMDSSPECTIVTPSSSPFHNFDAGTGTPYTPGTLSTTPSGYSSRRESTTQIEHAQTYSLSSIRSPSVSSKVIADSSFEAMSQKDEKTETPLFVDPSGQMSWLAPELAMYTYNEDTTSLEVTHPEQWAYSFPRHSNTQAQCLMSNTVAKYDSAGRSLQTFGFQQFEHPCLLPGQVDLLPGDAGSLAATVTPPLGTPFEYTQSSSDTSASGRTSSRDGRRHRNLEYRVAKVPQKHRSDHLCFPEQDRRVTSGIPATDIVLAPPVPQERHKGRPCRLCKKRFGRPEHLARHIKTHDKEPDWFCPLCPKGIQAERHDNLKAHIVNTHLSPTEKGGGEKTNVRVTMREYHENRFLPKGRIFWVRYFLKELHATDACAISDLELWRQQLQLHEAFRALLNNTLTIHDRFTYKNGRPKEKPHRMWTMIGWSIQEAQNVLIRDIDPDYKGDPQKTIWDVDPRHKALLARELRLADRKYLGTDMPGTQAMGLEDLDPAWIALKEGRLSPEEEVQYGAPMHMRGLGTVPNKTNKTKPKRESRL